MQYPLHPQARPGLPALCAAAALALSLTAPAAQANVTLQFNYVDAAGTGFNDAAAGAQRRAALETAGTMFSNFFGGYFSNTGTIVLDATSENNAASSSLAAAGSNFQAPAGNATGFTLGEVVRTKIQTGTDLNGASADGTVNINFGINWQLNAAGAVAPTQFDFYSTMLHEFLHAMGWASSIARDGSSLFSGLNSWSRFDSFLTDKNGNPLIDPSSFALNAALWSSASIGGTGNGVFFSGPYALANSAGGARVGLYSPTTWSDGSSVSHLDTDAAAYNGLMMTHATNPGPSARALSALEVGVLADLGYSLVAGAVPEPSTYALMGLGLVVLAGAGRRARRADAAGTAAG